MNRAIIVKVTIAKESQAKIRNKQDSQIVNNLEKHNNSFYTEFQSLVKFIL
jgi:hypothetical protein